MHYYSEFHAWSYSKPVVIKLDLIPVLLVPISRRRRPLSQNFLAKFQLIVICIDILLGLLDAIEIDKVLELQ